jgi:hypothetical protein
MMDLDQMQAIRKVTALLGEVYVCEYFRDIFRLSLTVKVTRKIDGEHAKDTFHESELLRAKGDERIIEAIKKCIVDIENKEKENEPN